MSNFTPDYRDIDFQTMVERLRTLLSNTDSFRDYDFEGANITILMELVSYVGDLNTFFTNKLAQNIHTETANVFEVVHSLVRQQGHEPSGYVGAELVVDIRVYREDVEQSAVYFNENDQLYIPQWFTFDTGLTTDNGENIYYILTEAYTYDVTAEDASNGYADIQLTLRQGVLNDPVEYTGEDIVSNQIVMPFQNWDMSTYPYDESPQSILVTVGDLETTWTRINDFFDDISGLVEEDNAYMFLYDKYERNVIAFSNTRNVPELTDTIKVYLLETLGEDGNVASSIWSWDATTTPSRYTQVNGTVPVTDTILETDVDFLTNITNVAIGAIPSTEYVMQNSSGSAGGSNPQSIEELKEAGKAAAQSQQRNVTKQDYIGNLERRGDVTVANAWGEQEENPDTLILENYNKAYLSVIPTEWDNGNDDNVNAISVSINDEFSRNTDKALDFPQAYNTTWTDELLSYIEPRKMLGIYEYFILPELVYFRFDFGLKVKRSYNWVQVKETVKNKLAHYFLNSNREFGEVIDFREVVEFILDTSQVSPTDDFALVRGVQYLTVRDIMIYRHADRLESSVDSQEACEYMGGQLFGTVNDDIDLDSVTNGADGLVIGSYTDVPTQSVTGTGGGLTVDVSILGSIESFVTDTPVAAPAWANVANGDYSVVATGSASGINCTLIITFVDNEITETVIFNGGTGFVEGETLTIGFADIPTSGASAGSVDYTVAVGGIGIDGITVNNSGVGYATGDNILIDAHYLGGLTVNGTVGFDINTVTYSVCSIDSEIDEMYIYPENIYNYFPHHVELGYELNNDDAIYNDLQPIQLGFKQFPQIAIDLCTFTNEG